MPASSFNDIFLVPSLNSFHRRSKAKAPVKKAVWQKHTPRTTTTSDATAPRPVVRTPPVVAAEERVVVQLPTPVTASNKDTGSVAQQVAPRRAFSLTRFTDPLPSPIRSPLCRLSVLEFAAPSHRMPLKIAEVVQVAQENTGVEVEIEIEEVAEVEVKEAVVRPSRIPVWKGRTTHCSECGEPKIFSERGQRVRRLSPSVSCLWLTVCNVQVEEEANVAEVADEHSAPDAAPAVPETTEPASLPVGQSSTRVAEPAAALPETSGATNVEPAPEAANTNKDIRAKLGESFEDPQSTAPEDTVSDNEESPSPVVAQDEETQQQIPEPAALTARDEDTTPANIVTRSTPWTPLSLPRIKKTAAKKSSLLSRIFSKVKAPFTPTPTSEQPVQDPVDSAKFAVLNELMQFNCEGRKLRKYIRPELLVAVDPVLDAFSVTPEADAIIREASVLDVLFEYDASFEAEEAREKGAEATPEKGEAKSVEVKERAKEAEEVAGGTTATIPSFALSESTNDDPDTTDSEPILGSPEETAVSILKDGSPVEPVPVCQPETENAPAALVVPPTEEREEEPAPVVMKGKHLICCCPPSSD
ncbi:hypothetical protein BXZ70DRAFT_121120 [Cristinia sonorae]|uniref:Uncharacterized protein n=1 Tax=Cristinia sonorae TaxID=1940300 RepID=A0A8K0XQH0_9AGAR|nr:hypothetical protein BXZ70DRAFT_121120 [Cristinia sonorae]